MDRVLFGCEGVLFLGSCIELACEFAAFLFRLGSLGLEGFEFLLGDCESVVVIADGLFELVALGGEGVAFLGSCIELA